MFNDRKGTAATAIVVPVSYYFYDDAGELQWGTAHGTDMDTVRASLERRGFSRVHVWSTKGTAARRVQREL